MDNDNNNDNDNDNDNDDPVYSKLITTFNNIDNTIKDKEKELNILNKKKKEVLDKISRHLELEKKN